MIIINNLTIHKQPQIFIKQNKCQEDALGSDALKYNDNIPFKSIYTKNSIQGIYFPRQISFGANYNKFIADYTKVYGDVRKMPEIVAGFLYDESLFIGKGVTKIVHSFPKLEGYVIARIKDMPIDKTSMFKKAPDIFNLGDKFNFGLPIAENGHGTFILEMIAGKSNSIENWGATHLRFNVLGKPVTRQEAQQFLNSIQVVAEMPQSAFDHLAEKIKYLSEKGVCFDLVNPNNVLVDKKGGELNCIDFSKNLNSIYEKINNHKPINGVTDMIASLCDSMLNLEYCKALDNNDAQKVEKLTRIIIEKCKKAGKNTGLGYDKSITILNFKAINGYARTHFQNLQLRFYETELFSRFAEHYNL